MIDDQHDSSNANPPDVSKLPKPHQGTIKTVVKRAERNIDSDDDDDERLLLPRSGEDEEEKSIKLYT